MTQTQFMYELMVASESFPDDVKYNIMNDYTRFFHERLEAGQSESEIISQLPSPKSIAEAYASGEPLLPGESFEESRREASRVTALGVFLFILLIPVCIVYEVLALAAGVTAAVLLLALCVAAAFVSVACFGVTALSRGFILLGIGGIFITVALVLFSVAAFRAIAEGFAWFPKMTGRVLKLTRGGAA